MERYASTLPSGRKGVKVIISFVGNVPADMNDDTIIKEVGDFFDNYFTLFTVNEKRNEKDDVSVFGARTIQIEDHALYNIVKHCGECAAFCECELGPVGASRKDIACEFFDSLINQK